MKFSNFCWATAPAAFTLMCALLMVSCFSQSKASVSDTRPSKEEKFEKLADEWLELQTRALEDEIAKLKESYPDLNLPTPEEAP